MSCKVRSFEHFVHIPPITLHYFGLREWCIIISVQSSVLSHHIHADMLIIRVHVPMCVRVDFRWINPHLAIPCELIAHYRYSPFMYTAMQSRTHCTQKHTFRLALNICISKRISCFTWKYCCAQDAFEDLWIDFVDLQSNAQIHVTSSK